MVSLLLLLPLLWGGSLQESPEYELRVQESVTVQACMDVQVPCSFSYPWSSGYSRYSSSELYISWFRERDHPHNDAVATNNQWRRVKPETQGRFRLVGDPSNNDCSLSIREARLSDSGKYYLRVERGPHVKYSYREKELNLQVTGKPNIHFLKPLESGRPTRLTCSLSLACDERHNLLFSWAGDALDAMNANTLHSPELTLTPRPQDHGTKLTCRVTVQGLLVTLETTVQLNVSYAPRNLRISLSFRNITESPALQLLCVADSNPPAQLSWFWGSPALEATPISSTGVLEIPQVGAGDEGEVTCRAQNPLGSQQVSFSLSVQKGPPPCSCETEEQQGSWPLVLTLIRGALMGAGFLLTYGLTWTYYTSLHHLLPSWLPVGASSFLPHIRGTSSLTNAPGPGLEDADVVPPLLHPETLHSLKLTPTPRPQDQSTHLTCWVNLQGSQQAHVFLPQMPRGTSASASPSEASQVGQDLSSAGLGPAPGTSSKGWVGGLECDQIWEEHGETPPHPTSHALDHTHLQYTQRQCPDGNRSWEGGRRRPQPPPALLPRFPPRPSRFSGTPRPFSSQRARRCSCSVLLTATPLHS
ncbi:sialic acid-binding Ig-like lectin 14 isoform X2 [Moschus berezovskii]|uniref:sialic acid-binding Ig-like lectin 14 isoform X2 n=1 Tax=Moschus berezovskii TaxID=68408 RepID=UPI002444AF58|nr:sialic acid-binding Ig-like lectin 14 isoform X2 [Moschus berezovskii]